MNNRIMGFSLLLAAGLGSGFAFAADPLQHACHFGLFKRSDEDPRKLPLPPVQKLEALVDKHSFKISDLRDRQEFVFQVFAAPPGAQLAAMKALDEDIAEDGATLVVPVDLTGSGVSDLIYARRDKDWGGWKVLTNGARMPKPFQGFVAGLYDKGQDSARSSHIAADTHDLVVDDDLLAAVGDFLGDGTEQLAYTRPGWTQIWVVGAHGVVQMSADLKGIEANGPGVRMHWLFAFKPTGAKHTRLAYYRMGRAELTTFAPAGGMTFKRDLAPLKENWHRLSQNSLDWPKEAPGQPERKAHEAKEAVGLE